MALCRDCSAQDASTRQSGCLLCGCQQQFLSPSAAPRRAFKLLGQQPRATRTEADSSDSKVACFTLSGTGFIFAAPTTSKAEEWVARVNAGTRWTEVSEDTKSRGHRIPVLEVLAPALAECDPSEEDLGYQRSSMSLLRLLWRRG